MATSLLESFEKVTIGVGKVSRIRHIARVRVIKVMKWSRTLILTFILRNVIDSRHDFITILTRKFGLLQSLKL